MAFDRGIQVGVGADGSGKSARRNFRARRSQAAAVALPFGIERGQLQAEGDRLGMDAVAAADARRTLVFDRAALERRQHPVDVGQQKIARACELHRKAGIKYIR